MIKDNNIIEMSAKDLKNYKLIKEGEFFPGDLVEIDKPEFDKKNPDIQIKPGRYAKLECSLLTKKAKFKIIDNVVYRKV